MILEKHQINISGIRKIEDKRVKVILKDGGKEIWLPISQAERFGNRIFIPTWLARRYKVLNEKSMS